VFDKTGTITEGKPTVTSVTEMPNSKNGTEQMLQVLASLEQHSEHPIGRAIVAKAKKDNVLIIPVEQFKAFPGKGIEGSIKGILYIVGNKRFMEERGVQIHTANNKYPIYTNGETTIFLAEKTRLLGFVTLSDTSKKEAQHAIQSLTSMGIQSIMLSGDDQKTAEHIAQEVGITTVIADVLPEHKLEKINYLKEHSKVAMVGDGVNDAPALAAADVGIAMATGTDAAMATAGITILHGDIEKVVQSIVIAKKTMQIVRQNLFWAFFYNVIGIPFAAGAFYPAFGIQLSPVFAGAAMALSSVSVVTNSLRLKTIKL
jgi:heavy metal translocating P-type ATPase